MWIAREGSEPLPHIGPGPLTDEEYEAAEDAYMRAHFGAGAEIPADAPRPRDTGAYRRIEPPATSDDASAEPATAQDEE